MKVAENIQTCWDTGISSFNIYIGSQSKKLQARDARGDDEVYRQAVRSGIALDLDRAKPKERLQLSLGLAFFIGAKIPKGPKCEELVLKVKRYRF